MGKHWRSQPWNKPIWELTETPQTDFNLIDAFCPECSYHTAWVKAKGWVHCAWCFETLDIKVDAGQQIFESKSIIYGDPSDYSDLISMIAICIESIAMMDKTIDCDRLISKFTNGARWKSIDYESMTNLYTCLTSIFGIASSLKTLERKTKACSDDRLLKFTNYVSTKTGETYPHWSDVPENYLQILKTKISAAIAGVKAA